jgi:hypothetical protein
VDGDNDMAERFQGVLRASIQMALAFRSPMTAGEIAAHLTRLNPQRRFDRGGVTAVLRSYPDLFVIESRRFLGLGPARWRLHPEATASKRTHLVTPPATQVRRDEPAPTPRTPAPPSRPAELTVIPNALDDLELIDDAASAAESRSQVSAERKALGEERARRRARRGRAPAARPGLPNYRDVIDPSHPINKLSDDTLNRLASNVPHDLD